MGGNYRKSKTRVEQRQLVRWGRGRRGSIPWKVSLRERERDSCGAGKKKEKLSGAVVTTL